jgi:predicted GIY-YIG superfamily endonuclease
MKDQAVIENLIKHGFIPEFGTFEVTHDIIDAFYDEYGHQYARTTKKIKSNNIRYAKKLAALSLIKLNEKRREIVEVPIKKNPTSKSGFVYVISNEAFPDFYKIGITRNVKTRLNTYQTCDPLRRYKIEHYIFHNDIRKEEKRILQEHRINAMIGEWIPKARYKEIFKQC